MNHLQIAYFLAVAKYGSFSEASRRLFVAQSAISKQIIALETKLGIKLFKRTSRKIELTPAGEILYRELEKYNDWLEQAIDMAKSIDQGKTGLLNIGILHGLDLPAAQVTYFSSFSNACPGIQINVKRVKFQDEIQELYIGSLDLLVTFAFLVPNMQDLESMPIGQDRDMLIVSKSHSLGKLEKVTAKDFENYTFITIEPALSRFAYINSVSYLKSVGITPSKVIHVPSIEDIMLAVEFGLGYGVSSSATRLSAQESTKFLDLNENKPGPTVEMLIVWREDTSNPAVSVCLEHIKKCIRQNNYKKEEKTKK
ncbi:MAG: LysR family transcriptional regulator [Clostridiales bacterium]|nr:LysR family transcriptional regulator [Clostridiales bacterium]